MRVANAKDGRLAKIQSRIETIQKELDRRQSEKEEA